MADPAARAAAWSAAMEVVVGGTVRRCGGRASSSGTHRAWWSPRRIGCSSMSHHPSVGHGFAQNNASFRGFAPAKEVGATKGLASRDRPSVETRATAACVAMRVAEHGCVIATWRAKGKMLDLDATKLFHCYNPNRDGGYVKTTMVLSTASGGMSNRVAVARVVDHVALCCGTGLSVAQRPRACQRSALVSQRVADGSQEGGAAMRTPTATGPRSAAGSTSIRHYT